MNILKYILVDEFVADIVRAELRQVIKDQRKLLAQTVVGDKDVLDAAKVLLRYYG